MPNALIVDFVDNGHITISAFQRGCVWIQKMTLPCTHGQHRPGRLPLTMCRDSEVGKR
jgi:hypothetical protein